MAYQKYIKITTRTDKMITELSNKRKAEDALNKTKQDVVAEVIEALYKREMK